MVHRIRGHKLPDLLLRHAGIVASQSIGGQAHGHRFHGLRGITEHLSARPGQLTGEQPSIGRGPETHDGSRLDLPDSNRIQDAYAQVEARAGPPITGCRGRGPPRVGPISESTNQRLGNKPECPWPAVHPINESGVCSRNDESDAEAVVVEVCTASEINKSA